MVAQTSRRPPLSGKQRTDYTARPSGAVLAVLAALVFTGVASGADAPTPTSPALPSPSATPSPGAQPAPQPTETHRTLKIGSRGGDVRALQKAVRRRGHRLSIDGVFGRQTQRALKQLQRHLRLRPSGVATPSLQHRLGIRSETSTPTTPPIDPGNFPLAGPNAANAKYLKAFPVAGKHHYISDFGAPRPQGVHEGNDIMADRNIPIRAVANGTVKRLSRTETPRGGIWIWLTDTVGNEYFYAHMESIAPGLEAGNSVSPGQVIGAVGNSGDARSTATHLHFQIHPGGDAATDPNPDLRAVDPDTH